MRTKLVMLVFIWLMFATQPGRATEFRSGNDVSVPAGTSIVDDLVASGANVNVGGRITGDLIAAGSQITTSGAITQSAILAGGTVNYDGSATDDLIAAGGTVNILGKIGQNALVTGGSVTMSEKASVARDLSVAAGNLRVGGKVARNLRATGGNVAIDGTIGGNADVQAGTLTVGPGAVVRGNLTFTGNQQAKIAPGARILGKTTFIKVARPEKPAAAAATGMIVFWVLSLMGAYVVGAIFIAMMPVGTARIADRIREAPWWSLLTGFIVLVVTPVAVMILMVTVIGIPLSLIVLAAYMISIYLARIFAAIAIGRWIFGMGGRTQPSQYLTLLVGLVLLWVFGAIPFIGWIVRLAALLLGLGALASSKYTMTRENRQSGQL